jgi:hypothetical protein
LYLVVFVGFLGSDQSLQVGAEAASGLGGGLLAQSPMCCRLPPWPR